MTTVEPLNKGHFGSSLFVLYREVVLCSEAKLHYSHTFGAKLCVHYWEVVPCAEGPLSEVPLYNSTSPGQRPLYIEACMRSPGLNTRPQGWETRQHGLKLRGNIIFIRLMEVCMSQPLLSLIYPI